MRAPLTATLLLSLLAFAGCGDDDAGGGETDLVPASLTRAEYIERADTVCQQLYEQRDPLEIEAVQAAQQGDTERAAQIFENAAEITGNRLVEIEALPLPAGDEQALQAMIARAEATIPPARQAAEAIRDQQAAKLEAASRRGLEAATLFNNSAVGFGFLVCGRGAAVDIG